MTDGIRFTKYMKSLAPSHTVDSGQSVQTWPCLLNNTLFYTVKRIRSKFVGNMKKTNWANLLQCHPVSARPESAGAFSSLALWDQMHRKEASRLTGPLHTPGAFTLSLQLARASQGQLCARLVCGVDGAEKKDTTSDLPGSEFRGGDKWDPWNTHSARMECSEDRGVLPKCFVKGIKKSVPHDAYNREHFTS